MKKQQVEEEHNLNDAITTTITTTDGRVLTISNFISTFGMLSLSKVAYIMSVMIMLTSSAWFHFIFYN